MEEQIACTRPVVLIALQACKSSRSFGKERGNADSSQEDIVVKGFYYSPPFTFLLPAVEFSSLILEGSSQGGRHMEDKHATEGTDAREFLLVLAYKGTLGILRHLNTHEKARYTEFNLPVSVSTLNMRLRELLKLNLINHFLDREEARKEWYVITDKGRETLQHLEALIALQNIGTKEVTP